MLRLPLPFEASSSAMQLDEQFAYAFTSRKRKLAELSCGSRILPSAAPDD